ncbi:hypothetical protein CPAR01_14997 [Colletotrichum paranaense]|uniref:Uncharacterized protein n=1 Tax=Colletotrichum paranaense TaxID=1914294 RepID=A0ABQ9S1G9_9PEZI|nr:uncharacterized protein CPAR01_14997 [Colletotrichum paranaense]KAK1521474.1 hypothetical protein CPAR01_14997 [Colletotrichum paranaense]
MQSLSSMQYSLLCHSPKAKASPPRGPDLAEEKSGHQGEQESPETAGRGTRKEAPMEHEEMPNYVVFSARQADGVKLPTMTSNDQHERVRRPYGDQRNTNVSQKTS